MVQQADIRRQTASEQQRRTQKELACVLRCDCPTEPNELVLTERKSELIVAMLDPSANTNSV